MFDTQRELLAISLGAAVPLWVAELQTIAAAVGAHEFAAELRERATRCSGLLAHNGDALMFRQRARVIEMGKGNPPVVVASTAQVFNALAEGVACMAFCPGGVKCFDARYAVVNGALLIENLPEPERVETLPVVRPDPDLFTPFTGEDWP